MATKKVRMLVDHKVDGVQYKANDAVELDSDAAKTLVKTGVADDSPAAVKHVLEHEGRELLQHTPPTVEQAAAAVVTDPPAGAGDGADGGDGA